MRCFMCYEEVEKTALRVRLNDDWIYICHWCLEDLNLEAVEDEKEDT